VIEGKRPEAMKKPKYFKEFMFILFWVITVVLLILVKILLF